MMKEKILVTGGTGFIGSHTVVELQNEGYEVVIVDNFSNSEPFIADRIETITGVRPQLKVFDLCDAQMVDSLFRKEGNIMAVIHFAALKSVSESVAHPLGYYRNNLTSLINLLDSMKKNSCRLMVFSSSCTVYGQPDHLPVTESEPLKPALSPYGNTKRMSEEIIGDACNAYPGSMAAIMLRYFNPIGAHPSALIGELPRGIPENLVPFITQTAAGLRSELKVYGNDYNTPDGTAIRDYLHVVDLAKAHVLALRRLLDNENTQTTEVFNLGTGRGVSVMEAIQSFERVSGHKLPFAITGRRPGDIEKIWADPGLANKILGWKTESTLDEAMRTAWLWQKKLSET